MIDMTYDPAADTVYFCVGMGDVDHTEEAGPFIYDVDGEGRVIGIEILPATKTLAPGPWQHARLPGTGHSSTALQQTEVF